MKSREQLRQLRKQSLQLRAQRHRLAIRQDWEALRAPFTTVEDAAGTTQWLAIAGSLLEVARSQKKGRWARALSVGLLSWKILKRVLAKPETDRPDAH